MKRLKKTGHYLVHTPHSFCFRVNVPKDLQRLVGRRELRYSLKTGYIGVARVKAQIIAAQVHQIFECLRKGGRRLTDLTDEKIQELVQQYLKEYIEIQGKPVYRLGGVRHKGGGNLILAPVWNVGTCRPDGKGETQVETPQG